MLQLRKPPGRIFINYRRDDVAGVAGRLADSLNRYFGDGRVFRDVDGIQAGANFEDVLKHTAQNADAMIVLIGRHWATIADAQGRPRLHDQEDWVAREIASAIERRIPIYPVLIDNTPMPRAEELPGSLHALLRCNAISISDQRWTADVTRLAKVVAIDIPGSAAERTLRGVQWLISLALFASVSATAGLVALNVSRKLCPVAAPAAAASAATEVCPSVAPFAIALEPRLPLELWQSGVTYVVVVGSAMLLLLVARLIDPARRRHAYAAAVFGLLGALVGFVALAWLREGGEEELAAFFGSTFTATGMLALMNLSGFKAR